MNDDLTQRIERMATKAKREVWEEIKATMPEFMDSVKVISETFGIEAIWINGKTWARSESGRQTLRDMR